MSTDRLRAGSVGQPPSRSVAFRALAVAVAGLAVALIAVSDSLLAAAERPIETAIWIGFVSTGAMLTIRVLPRERMDVSLSAPVAIAAAVVLGPPLALLVGTAGLTSARELRRGVSGWARTFNHAQEGLSTWAAAMAATLAADLPAPWNLVAAAGIAAVTYRITNVVFVGLALSALGRLTPPAAARRSAQPVPRFTFDFFVVMLLGLLLALAYEAVGLTAPALLAVPMWLAYRLMGQLRESADRAEALAERVHDLEALDRLSGALHRARTAEYACQVTGEVLGEALGGPVECRLDGQISEGLTPIPIPGQEPAALAMSAEMQEARPLAQAAAGALGTVLQRLAAEYEVERLLLRQQGLADRILAENVARKRAIADGIEDQSLQHIAAGLMQLDNARACLRLGHQDRADQLARISQDLIDVGMTQARDAVAALRDTTHLYDDDHPVDELDVGQLLSRLVEDVSIATHLRCTLSLTDPPPRLPPLLTIAAVQIANSCLAAAAQTDADQAHLQLGVNGHLILEVRADRGGFAQPPRAMLHRVQLAGGTVTIDFEDDADVLRAVIPLVGYMGEATA